MNPAWIDAMSWEMAEVYGAVTDQIMINIARYFPFYNSVDELPRSAFEYQVKMLAQMGQVNRETVRIIRNNLKGADDALKGCLEGAIVKSLKKTEPALYDAVKKGIFALPTTPVVSPNQMRAFQLYYKQAAEKLNLVNTVMLESTGSAYRQAVTDVVSAVELADKMNRTQVALDVGAAETITGVSSWNTAVKHSIDKMKDGGITGFIDHGGHRWSAEAYAAMDIRTTLANTARAAVWETNQNFGNDLYLVSSHNGARPLCYPWQNKVISSMDAARDTVDLYGNPVHVYAQSETSYGEPAGLFGINCGHMANPFIPGVSTINGEPQNEEDNAKTYAESQEQRRLERKLREEKRDVAIAKAQGASDEEIKRLRDKCRSTSADIDDFCDKTGRARHMDREAVYTQREFPEQKKYDVTKFETEQKERISEFYKKGGAQKQFTFGQMIPNIPLVPKAPEPTPTPAPAVAPTPDEHTEPVHEVTQIETPQNINYDFGGSNATITTEQQETIKATIEKLQEQYQIPNAGNITIGDFRSIRGIGYNQPLEDLLDDLEVKTNEHYFGVHAQFVPNVNGKTVIEYIDTTNISNVPMAQSFEEIHDATIRSNGFAFNVAYGLEADTVHEYAHWLAEAYGFYGSEDSELIEWFMALDKERIKRELSIYAATNWNEFIAESFLQSFSPYQSELSKEAMAFIERKMGR